MKKSQILTISMMTIGIINFSSSPSAALSFGEAVGAGVTTHVINTTLDRTLLQPRNPQASNNSSNSSQSEFNRGLQDGFNRAQYINPNNSLDYDSGFSEGRQRAAQGWVTPFTR